MTRVVVTRKFPSASAALPAAGLSVFQLHATTGFGNDMLED
jgi:hypothetical protein